MTKSIENAEETAQKFMMIADELGTAINTLNKMARDNWATITAESQNYEIICLSGEEVVKALREMAMRLDRAALIKYLPDEGRK